MEEGSGSCSGVVYVDNVELATECCYVDRARSTTSTKLSSDPNACNDVLLIPEDVEGDQNTQTYSEVDIYEEITDTELTELPETSNNQYLQPTNCELRKTNKMKILVSCAVVCLVCIVIIAGMGVVFGITTPPKASELSVAALNTTTMTTTTATTELTSENTEKSSTSAITTSKTTMLERSTSLPTQPAETLPETDPSMPQECSNATNLTQSWRMDHDGRNIEPGGDHSFSGQACDFHEDLQWFRFTGEAGVQMLDKCPKYESCGTSIPYWTDEEMPTIVGEITLVNVYGTWHICKHVTRQIDVLRCSWDTDYDLIYRYHPTKDAFGNIGYYEYCAYAFCGMNYTVQ